MFRREAARIAREGHRIKRVVLPRFRINVLVEAMLNDGVDQALFVAEVVVQRWRLDAGAFAHGARGNRGIARLVHQLGRGQ